MKTKKCSSCEREKLINEFRFRNKQLGILQTQCKDCCSAAGKAHYQANRKEQIKKQVARNKALFDKFREFKKTLSCSACNESTWYCLDFHHLDPSKKDFELALVTNRVSWKKVVAEVSKCVCLCSNCHRKVHQGDIAVKKEWKIMPLW